MKQTFLSYLIISLVLGSSSGAEFQVNTRTSLDQANAAVAMDPTGGFVVVWSSRFGTAGRSNDIFGCRFDPNCNPVGEEFQVNAETSSNQKEPSIGMNAAGSFIITWQGPGGDDEDIFARRFDPNGLSVGGEFCINSYTDDKQLCPSVAMSADGSFIVVWESMDILEEGKRAICGRLYNGSGTGVGAEFVIDEEPSNCRYPDVAVDADGNFAVVWMQDKSSNSIMAKLYNADGSARTETFEVSTIGFSSVTPPSIAMDAAGHFVVVWDGDPEFASLDDVHARLYNPDGMALGEQFVVNTTTAGSQQNPKAAMNDEGGVVIVWDSRIDPNIYERDIFGQRFASQSWDTGLGIPIGDEFQVNTYVAGDQKCPDVVVKENGEFVTVWQSDGQDGSGWGVFGEVGPKVGSVDFSGDGFVDFHDYCILAEEWLKLGNPLKADLIDDNKIDGQDLEHLCRYWLTPCYRCGEVDFNEDSKIDFKDFCFWAFNWLKQGPNLGGDVTENGIVDLEDLKALAFHWTGTCE